MDAIGAGLITLANGALTTLGALASPVVIAVLLAGISLAWLAAVEIEDLNRLGAKPDVVRH